MEQVEGIVGNVPYSIDLSVVDRLKKEYNIDAIKEIEEALKKVQRNEDKSTQRQGIGN